MNQHTQRGHVELVARLKHARKVRARAKMDLIRELTRRRQKPGQIGNHEKIIATLRAYGAALAEMSRVEADIEEQQRIDPSLVSGGSIDLANARDEIIARIARFRER